MIDYQIAPWHNGRATDVYPVQAASIAAARQKAVGQETLSALSWAERNDKPVHVRIDITCPDAVAEGPLSVEYVVAQEEAEECT